MHKSKKLVIAKCVAIIAGIPILIFAHANGPDPRLTGGPGDRTCLQSGCHLGQPQASGSIGLTFSTGTTYTPGQTLTVTLKITDPSARVYGFQVSARPASNTQSGQAGTFTPSSGQFVLCEDGHPRRLGGSCTGLEFIEHTAPSSSGTFTFDWIPPATDIGPVVFYAAGNAANGNNIGADDRNDHIYTLGATGVTLTPAAATTNGPTITSVINGATFADNSPVEAGSWMTIKGTNLAGSTGDWNAFLSSNGTGVLPTDLGGVSVTVAGRPAAIYFYSANQLNVQVPNLENGTGTFAVVVKNENGSAQSTVVVQSQAPGFFMFDPENRKYIAGLTQDPAPPVVYLGKPTLYPQLNFRPAKPGEVVQLYGTGFGTTNPPRDAGKIPAVAPLERTPTATIGGQPAAVQFAGLVGVGLYQINLVVPNNTPDGDAEVIVNVNGTPSQSGAFITIQR